MLKIDNGFSALAADEDSSSYGRHKDISSDKQWGHLDHNITFGLSPINISSEAQAYLFQQNNEVYSAACKKTDHVLQLFPPDDTVLDVIIQGKQIRDDFFDLSRLVKAVRIRRIVILDDMIRLKKRIGELNALHIVCQQKLDFQQKRTEMLEEELMKIKVYDGFISVSPFCSFLSHSIGWGMIVALMIKEYRALRTETIEHINDAPQIISNVKNDDDNSADNYQTENEDFNVKEKTRLMLNIDELQYVWKLLKYWQIIHSVAVRIHVGSERYKLESQEKMIHGSSGLELIASNKANKKKDSRSKRKGGGSHHNKNETFFADYDMDLSPQDQGEDIISSPMVKRNNIASNAVFPTLDPLLPAGDGGVTNWTVLCEYLRSVTNTIYNRQTTSSEEPLEALLLNAFGTTISALNMIEHNAIGEVIVVISDILSNNFAQQQIGIDFSKIISRMNLTQFNLAINEVSGEELETTQFAGNSSNGVDNSSHNQSYIIKQVVNSLIAISDEIADEIARIIKEPLVSLPSGIWNSSLEAIRKKRVETEGGKFSMKEEGAVEIDSQGAIRIIPNADDIIDTDVLHGNLQRIRLHIAMPQVQKLLEYSKKKLFHFEMELCAIVQYGYSSVSPYCQRAIRGFLIRNRVQKYILNDLIIYSMHAAAATIQSYQRAKIGRALVRQRRFERHTKCAILIQKTVRGYLGRKKGRKMMSGAMKDLLYRGAVAFQKIVRGYLGRRKVSNILAEAQRQRQQEISTWGCSIIQKIIRGYIARNRIFKSMHIRKSLSPYILGLAERFLYRPNTGGGDLWGFLFEVDCALKRLKQEIIDINEREDKYAVTFVDKVTDHRQSNFESAWTTFSSHQSNRSIAALHLGTASTTKMRSGSHLEGNSHHNVVGTAGIPISDGRRIEVNDMGRAPTSFMNPTSPSPLDTMKLSGLNPVSSSLVPPGALLRHAVADTIKATQREQEASRSIEQKQSSIISGQISSVYKNDAIYAKKKEETAKKLRMKNNRPQLSSSSSTKPPNSSTTKSPSKTAIGITEKKSSSPSRNIVSSAVLDEPWLTSSGVPGTAVDRSSNSAGSNSPVRPRSRQYKHVLASNPKNSFDELTASSKVNSPGVSLLIDIPKGINDSLERLIKAAAIRCYVPDIYLKGTMTVEESYQLYLSLPDKSFAKVRYEQKAYKWAQGLMNRLAIKGIKTIKDVLPSSKMCMFFRNAESPPVLLYACRDILHALIKMGSTAEGLSHVPSHNKIQDIMNDKGTTLQVLKAANACNVISKEDIEITNESTAITQPSSGLFNHSKEDMQKIAEKMLDTLITSGDWTELDAPIERLLQHAAFLICSFDVNNEMASNATASVVLPSVSPRISNANNKGLSLSLFNTTTTNNNDNNLDDSNNPLTKEENEMGQEAFKQFTLFLCSLPTQDDMVNLIRKRFRAAVILSTPYELTFKEMGIFTVKDLATTSAAHNHTTLPSDVRKVLNSMPRPYRYQVDALVSMTISTFTHSYLYPTQKDKIVVLDEADVFKQPSIPLKKEVMELYNPTMLIPTAIRVPLAFDSKFQRGPLDPYGRPARLPGQLPSLRSKAKDFGAVGRIEHATKGIFDQAIAMNTRAAKLTEKVDVLQKKDHKLKGDNYVKLESDIDITNSLPSEIWSRNSATGHPPRKKNGDGGGGRSRAGEDDINEHEGDDDGRSEHTEIIDDMNESKMFVFEPWKDSHHFDHIANHSNYDNSVHHTHDVNVDLENGTVKHDLHNHRYHDLENQDSFYDSSSKVQALDRQTFKESAKDMVVEDLANRSNNNTANHSSHRRKNKSVSEEKHYIDTETMFDRPHVCSYEGCSQAFSRPYTLKIHEKSHIMFPNYHKYRHDPMVSLDVNAEHMISQKRQEYLNKTSLPYLRQLEVEELLRNSSN